MTFSDTIAIYGCLILAEGGTDHDRTVPSLTAARLRMGAHERGLMVRTPAHVPPILQHLQSSP